MQRNFTSDKKWIDYLPYCDSFYFCSDQWLWPNIESTSKTNDKTGAGFIFIDENSVAKVLEDRLEHKCLLEGLRNSLTFSIARTISNKVVQGH
ncbi:MmcB family DNA repair protein [Priestia aryabhattai]